MKLILILLLIVFSPVLKAQHLDSKCTSSELLKNYLVENPQMHQELEEFERQIVHQMASQKLQTRSADITLPVVVHIIYKTNAENISNEQVYSQIDALNRDFNKQNNETSTTSPSFIPLGVFQNLVADCGIHFQLATRDAEGNPTIGIVRHETTKAVWAVSDDMKIPAKGGFAPWNPAKYLNLYVCNMGSKSLGFSSFPGMPASIDGVVIDFKAFGTNGTAAKPFNLGRTCVHEVGHWLGLFHIWGDSDCGNDYVDDTPTQKMEHTGCPTTPQYSTCKGTQTLDMSMNYMDYVNDACMYMFTNGQKARMLAVLDKKRGVILSSDGILPAATRSCAMKTLQTKSIQSGSVDITWEAIAGVAEYTLEFKPLSNNNWTSIKSKIPYCTLSNLQAGLTYELRIKTDCLNAPYSKTEMFITESVALRQMAEKEAILVYPNPVSDFVTISIQPETESDFKVSITDINGQLRFDKSYSPNSKESFGKVQLDFTELPQGVYFIVVSKNGFRAVKKVMKVRK